MTVIYRKIILCYESIFKINVSKAEFESKVTVAENY